MGPPVEESSTGRTTRAGSFGDTHLDVAADGQRFLMLKQAATPDESNELATVVVVKNSIEELKRLVPVPR